MIPMTKRKFINIVLLVFLFTSLSFGGYFYYQFRKLKNNPNVEYQKEAQDLLSRVAKIYLIPTGEEPTIATVSDPNALRDQAFFTGSQKGDKVLIFSKAGRAVLYRPSIDKIIETAPINSTNDQDKTLQGQTGGSLEEKSF
jgi:hypothetical protein